jgi:hypothetical protein
MCHLLSVLSLLLQSDNILFPQAVLNSLVNGSSILQDMFILETVSGITERI